MMQGRADDAESQYLDSLRIYREMGNVDLIVYPLGSLGRLAYLRGDLERAEALLIESIYLARTAGSQVSIADWQMQYGKVLLDLGLSAEAQACFQEALERYREMNNERGQADALIYLANAMLPAGTQEQILPLLWKGLTLHAQVIQGMHRSHQLGLGADNPFTIDMIELLLSAVSTLIALEQMVCAARLFIAIKNVQNELLFHYTKSDEERLAKAERDFLVSANNAALMVRDQQKPRKLIEIVQEVIECLQQAKDTAQ